MTSHKDYYAILGVSPQATAEEIEAAYEELARECQPFEYAHPLDARRMAELDEAFDILDDPSQRADYDQSREAMADDAGGTAAAEAEVVAPAGSESPPWFALGLLAAGVIGIVAAGVLIVLSLGDGDKQVGSLDGQTATPFATPGPLPSQSPVTPPAQPPKLEQKPTTTASGLQYIDIEEGDGASPVRGSTVVLNYTGWLADGGTLFDSSLDNPRPAAFILGEVIDGFNEGVTTMKEGGNRRLIIPTELAYADSPPPGSGIPPGAALIFDIELIEVR